MDATIEIDGLRKRFGPVQALDGMAFTVRPGLTGLPLAPWQGLGVVALWTAGALLLGVLVLKFRDA